MPGLKICRESTQANYALTTSSTTTPEINIANWASGQIFIPTGSGIALLTFHVAPAVSTDAGTAAVYLPAYDSGGSAVTMTVVAGRAYPLPSAVMRAGGMRIVVDAINASFTVPITLKG